MKVIKEIKKVISIIAICLSIFCLTGCKNELVDEPKNVKYFQDQNNYILIYIDEETCVEYIYMDKGMSVRMNIDGTPMINKECLGR